MSDHFDGKRFFNPGVQVERSVGELLRWLSTRRPVKWPAHVSNPPAPPPPRTIVGNELAVTYIGHSTLLLQVEGLNVLTDPILTERASPFERLGPRRVRPPAVSFDALPPIHCVLLSHNHYDHMSVPTLRRLQSRWRPRIVTGLGNGAYLAGLGIDNAIEFDWWDGCDLAPGIRATYVPAQHWSKRGLFDRQRMLWGGHVLDTPAGRVYFAGDTGYAPHHFAAIRDRLGAPDIALLPIGSYEPRWFMAMQHMNPDEAVRAHGDLTARVSIAMHFSTFHLADEAIDAPTEDLVAARQRHGVPPERFVIPQFGQILRYRFRLAPHSDASPPGEET